MAVEAKRGCGYRECGALYLVADKMGWACGRLPLPTDQPQQRTMRMLPLRTALEPSSSIPCKREGLDCTSRCWARWPPVHERDIGFMWVGAASYSPSSFLEEARTMGLSKRVPALPAGLVIGETQVFLAHREAFRYSRCLRCGYWAKAGGAIEENCPRRKGEPHQYLGPGIFCGFTPSRVECLVEDNRLDEAWVQALRDKGVTILPVPADDPDHARQAGSQGLAGGPPSKERRRGRGRLDRFA